MASQENKAILQPQEIVAFDFETATSKMDSACALAVAVFTDQGEIKEKKHWLIQPPKNRYYSKNIAIHGITPQDTQAAKNFGELWPEILPYFENRDIMAHYAVFDTNVLAACLETYGLQMPQIGKVYCSCISSRRNLPALPNHKLPTVCAHLDIPLLRHHDALEDVVACAMIGQKLKELGLAEMSFTEAKSYSSYQREFFKKKS